jgi:ABC-type spermidine/putrescine transport system permease subunit I
MVSLPRSLVSSLQLLPAGLFLGLFFLIPLALTFVWGFWPRTEFWMEPGFTLEAYRGFVTTGRVDVYLQTLRLSLATVVISLLAGYPVAYYLARRLDGDRAFSLLFVFVLPFIISTIVRTFSWRFLLGRSGPINGALVGIGIVDRPLDWLLFSDVAVLIGLVTASIPFVVFPVWLSLRTIDASLLEASADLGAAPATTFRRVTLPLSLPGVFAASIFVFVTAFGSTAIPTLLGGGGYSTIGTTLTSVLGVLNYPLAAAISSVSIATMLALLGLWAHFFDLEGLVAMGGDA